MISEYEEQKQVIQYLELLGNKHDIIFTSIPNSTYTRSWGQKIKNKQSGLRAGLPDLFIIIKSKAVFIEMKRAKGDTVSKEQKKWLEMINKAGIRAELCKGFNEARRVIDSML